MHTRAAITTTEPLARALQVVLDCGRAEARFAVGRAARVYARAREPRPAKAVLGDAALADSTTDEAAATARGRSHVDSRVRGLK